MTKNITQTFLETKNHINSHCTTLSPQQINAIHAPLPTLVLAAAGTGKTRTAISRVVKAHKEDDLSLDSIFVTTFTRRASTEMAGRIQETLGSMPEYCGTFHHNCLKLIKEYPVLIEVHGYDSTIEIIDNADRDHILSEVLEPYKNALKAVDIKKKNAMKWMREGINELKGKGLYPVSYKLVKAKVNESNINVLSQKFRELPASVAYQAFLQYQRELERLNLVDFNDIIALPVFAMIDDRILRLVSKRFALVIVDEFQDCSELQFLLAEQLSSQGRYLYMVGDEDQLIYAWRDASLSRVMEFYDNPRFTVCYLEGNYRSQGQIVNLARAVITQNNQRSNKKIKAMLPSGDEPTLVRPHNTYQEARYIVTRIENLLKKKVRPSEIAVLYRTHDYSSSIEAELMSRGIDYTVAKAYNFFEYKEIKYCVAYLRLALNPDNEKAFKEIFNWPRRKNGPQSLKKLIVEAHLRKVSLFQALMEQKNPSSQNKDFIALIEKLGELMRRNTSVRFVMNTLVKELDMERILLEEYGISEGEIRMDRVKKLSAIIDRLKEEYGNYEDTITLLNNEMASSKKMSKEQKVQLMTIHSSKGLEFEHVFIIGAVNGLIPALHGRPGTIDNNDTSLEEERRLMYVAITRAKERLTLCAPEYIQRFGGISECAPSMFLNGLEKFYKNSPIEQNSA